jgi:hypothetical protein
LATALTQIVHIPPELARSTHLPKRLILYGDQGPALTEALDHLGKKVLGVDFLGPLDQLPRREMLADLSLTILLREVEELVEHVHRLPRESPVLVRLSGGDSLTHRTRITASLGLAVDLLYSHRLLDSAKLDELLKHYLYHKALRAPLEPFHSILDSLLVERNLDFWEAASLNPDHFLFADREGNLALSYKQLERGLFMGSLQDDPANWEQGQGRKEFDAYLAGLSRQPSVCLSCHFFFFCRGFLLFDAKSCRAWQDVFTSLLKAFGEINPAREQWRDLSEQEQAAAANKGQ